MMTNDREERIRRRAHEIWEREGRPEGLHEVHWLQARREIEAEDQPPAEAPKRPRRNAVKTEDTLAGTVRRSARKTAQVIGDAVSTVVDTVSEGVAPKRSKGGKKTASAAADAEPATKAGRRQRAMWTPADIKPATKAKTKAEGTRGSATDIAKENAGGGRTRKSKAGRVGANSI